MGELNPWLGWGNIVCAILFAALALPLMQGKVKRNDVYGVRFAAAMKSDEAWARYNRIGGRYLLAWSGVIGALGFVCLLVPPLAGFWIWFFGHAPLLVGIACWQTYRAGRRETTECIRPPDRDRNYGTRIFASLSKALHPPLPTIR